MRNPGDLLLDGKGHQPLDFLRGQARRFGDDLDEYTCHIGERVDRNRPEGVNPQKGQQSGEGKNQYAAAEGILKKFIDHAQSLGFNSSDFKIKAPSRTTFSPSFTPSRTSANVPFLSPTLIVLGSKIPGPFSTNTKVRSRSCCTAASGTTRISVPGSDKTRTVANISGFRRPEGFATVKRTAMVRVAVSRTSP